MDESLLTMTCPHGKSCGGCQLQGLSYAEQLREKQRRVVSLLGGFAPVSPIIGMERPLHYRNKVHAAFSLDRNRRVVSGVYQPGSHRVVPVDRCLIEDELADRIIVAIRGMLGSFGLKVYDERSGNGWLRHVLVRRAFATGQTMVVLVAVSPIFRNQKPFLAELLHRFPEISTVVLNINDRFGPVVLGARSKTLFGPGTIEDILCGKRFRLSPSSFYQVNPIQTEKLYAAAARFAALTGTETVLDAYCGIGTIGLSVSEHVRQVIGVELNAEAVKDAIANAKLNGVKNAWFTEADAGAFMERMARDGNRPDVVFMDPPRAGSDRRFLDSLLRVSPERIVYISCDPGTLRRDLDILVSGGCRVRSIQPVDMFPYTGHVETVCCLYHQKKDFISVPYEPQNAECLK